MYKVLIIIICCSFKNAILNAQSISGGIPGPNISNDIHVVGKYIIGPQGDTVILRGVNYAPYNWGWNSNELQIAQIANSNANAVRLVWYVNGGGAPTYANYYALDSAISKCVQAGMIAIPELHDQTCNNDTTALIALQSWWTNPLMQQILNKYKGYVIINYGNEALGSGAWSWLGGTTARFTNTYKTIITNLRNAGIDQPIMIDAPDCGGNETALLNIANSLQTHDPLNNIIFSVHAYWPLPASTATNLNNRILSISNASQPFILGEVANTSDCADVILIDSLLKYATQNNIGWLAWSWDHDNCPSRQMTTNGMYANTTAFGNKIIYNATYGLQTKAVKILQAFGPLSINEQLVMRYKLENDSAVINWNHIKEASKYYCQASADGINYTTQDSTLATVIHLTKNNFLNYKYIRIAASIPQGQLLYSQVLQIENERINFEVFPNPFSDQLFLNNNKYPTYIYNIHGQKIMEIDAFQKSINTSKLPAGLYYLRYITQTFIIQKP